MTPPLPREHVIIGTAGHIDHGKSALVRALTGIDPDTLPEEKERGMTIELGFVFMEDPGYEKQIVFIDVPGHEKFVKTMAAGASSVDAALFIVAADEGIAVQTREHFDILQLLGLRHGLVALTKADLVDEARLAELTAAVRAFVRGTFLEDATILPVSSVTGAGVEAVRAELREIGRRVRPRPDSGVFRMPVDRVFTIHGFGTVIAGTILSGTVRAGDRVTVYPDGLNARVRGVQVHGAGTDVSMVGRRTALNLDVRKELLRRGQCAAGEGSLSPTIRLDARLEVLRGAARAIKQRERVRVHVGTDEVIARLVLLGAGTIEPGAAGPVQLILESPTVALPGDRFVVRSFSPLLTIAGGTILDAAPGRHKRFDPSLLEGLDRLAGTLDEAVGQMVLQAGGRPRGTAEIAQALGRREEEVAAAFERLRAAGRLVPVEPEAPGRFVHRAAFDELEAFLTETVRRRLEANPHHVLVPFADVRAEFLKRGDAAVLKTLLDRLEARHVLLRKDGRLGLVGHEGRLKPKEQETIDRVERIFRDAAYASPLEEEVRKTLGVTPGAFKNILASLFERGLVIRLAEKVTYHRDTVEAVRAVVLDLIRQRGAVTIAELRDRLGLSRKYAQAILEYFDRTGLTRRIEDRHLLP